MSEASALRKRSDLLKLRELQARVPRVFEIREVKGDPPESIKLLIRIPTAKNTNYPEERQEVSEVTILLPDNYPVRACPTVLFSTPIWNPNVYDSGRWFYGDWRITENLSLFVTRLLKVIVMDPTIVNPESPANGRARDWYVQLRSRRPELFPTAALPDSIVQGEVAKVTWRSIK